MDLPRYLLSDSSPSLPVESGIQHPSLYNIDGYPTECNPPDLCKPPEPLLSPPIDNNHLVDAWVPVVRVCIQG